MSRNLHTPSHSDVIQGVLALEPRVRPLRGWALPKEIFELHGVHELTQLGSQMLMATVHLDDRLGEVLVTWESQ